MEEHGFIRPASVPKKVWYRYNGFRIEDIPDSRRDEAAKAFGEFFKDEPTSTVFRKITVFSESDKKAFMKTALDNNISLYAVDEDNNDEIVGVTILRVHSKDAPNQYNDSSLTTMKRLFTFLDHCLDGVSLYTYGSGPSKVEVDHVLVPLGLAVSPLHRGKGIGQALIQARHKMAAEVGIGATMGLYTSIYSQAIILGEGMKTFKEVPYNSYLENGVPIFAELNPPHPSSKVIGGLLHKASS